MAASASGKYIDYSQEEINGNGRTDIQIRCRKETIGIIEIKLKKGDENRTEAIRKGLDQLYERYSQNHRRIENQIILKLVLFCYNPNMRNLIGSIKNAIVENIEQRVGVKFTVFDPCKRNTIRIKLKRVYPL
ncbi:hypothetical protein AB6F58_22815 [Providencia hangzhouensis]